MANNITATAGALGFAAACADIYVWHLNGSALPVPEDTVTAFGVVIGVGTHALGIAASWAGNIANQLISKKLGITPPNPPNAGP